MGIKDALIIIILTTFFYYMIKYVHVEPAMVYVFLLVSILNEVRGER